MLILGQGRTGQDRKGRRGEERRIEFIILSYKQEPAYFTE